MNSAPPTPLAWPQALRRYWPSTIGLIAVPFAAALPSQTISFAELGTLLMLVSLPPSLLVWTRRVRYSFWLVSCVLYMLSGFISKPILEVIGSFYGR